MDDQDLFHNTKRTTYFVERIAMTPFRPWPNYVESQLIRRHKGMMFQAVYA